MIKGTGDGAPKKKTNERELKKNEKMKTKI